MYLTIMKPSRVNSGSRAEWMTAPAKLAQHLTDILGQCQLVLLNWFDQLVFELVRVRIFPPCMV